jgi:hypothetical protein
MDKLFNVAQEPNRQSLSLQRVCHNFLEVLLLELTVFQGVLGYSTLNQHSEDFLEMLTDNSRHLQIPVSVIHSKQQINRRKAGARPESHSRLSSACGAAISYPMETLH